MNREQMSSNFNILIEKGVWMREEIPGKKSER